jgi:hypothetical protein
MVFLATLRRIPFTTFAATILFFLFWLSSVHAGRFSDFYCANQTQAEKIIVRSIHLMGNKITKPDVIYRELLFRSGDTIPVTVWDDLLEQSRQNLLNTALFNFVEIETSRTGSEISAVDVTFSFIERWYLWPLPVVELADRNFNEWWETRDFSRVNYGLYLNHNNFRGRRELFQMLLINGYSQTFSLAYQKPNINPAQTIGLGFSTTLSRRHEVAYATRNDQLVFFDESGDYAIQSFTATASLSYRPKIHESHSLWLHYNNFRFKDTIYRLNPEFFINNKTSANYLSLVYEFRSDHRNLRYYPTAGHYFDLVLVKHGLGFLQNSKLNVFNINATYKKYLEFRPRWYLFAGASARMSFSPRRPFFMNRSLGYMYDFIRGYEYYVVNGLHAGILKTNLKYQLMPFTVVQLPFIKTEKFSIMHLSLYLGIHSDFGFVHEPNNHSNSGNRLPNRLLRGNGIGLDVVTYYDRVVRFEYSVNHMGEHGFFLHFLAPI